MSRLINAALVNGARCRDIVPDDVVQLSYPSELFAARTSDNAPLQVLHRRELYDTRHVTELVVLFVAVACVHQGPFDTYCW